MFFRREGGACLSSTVRKKSQNWVAYSTDENSETLESSALNDGYLQIQTIAELNKCYLMFIFSFSLAIFLRQHSLLCNLLLSCLTNI